MHIPRHVLSSFHLDVAIINHLSIGARDPLVCWKLDETKDTFGTRCRTKPISTRVVDKENLNDTIALSERWYTSCLLYTSDAADE